MDLLKPQGMIETWEVIKKTGLIVPGTYKKEINTLTDLARIFPASFINTDNTGKVLDSANLFDESAQPLFGDNWQVTHGTDGIMYFSTNENLQDAGEGDVLDITGQLQATLKTTGTSVGNSALNSFVVSGELDGPLTNPTGYMVLGTALDIDEAATPIYTMKRPIAFRSQAVSIASTRTFFIKWTIQY